GLHGAEHHRGRGPHPLPDDAGHRTPAPSRRASRRAGGVNAPGTRAARLRGVPVDPAGVWGIPTASIDWCEQNHVVTPWIAEFWNTLSSVAMVIAGLVGACTRRFATEVRIAFGLLILVGLGSIAFHATLRFELQMLDELPMLYLVTWLVWLLVETGP